MTLADSPEFVTVRNLVKHYPVRSGLLQRVNSYVRAVDGVSFAVRRAETLAVVGESGCGKSTLGRTVIRLTEPTAGSISIDGVDFLAQRGRALKRLRRELQMIFQDPFMTLDPRMTAGDSIREGLRIHAIGSRRERHEIVVEMLGRVGLQAHHADRYPHQFSGGQRQRIGIARALAVQPKLIVADEPVSALDVSVAAQILNLMKDLQDDLGLTYLLIGHNLPMVEFIATRVAVMYLGNFVEVGPRRALFQDPRHPYTVALLSAVPDIEEEARRERIILRGDVPSPVSPPSGCRFHTRCWLRAELGRPARCHEETPPLLPVAEDQFVACHFVDEVPGRRPAPPERDTVRAAFGHR